MTQKIEWIDVEKKLPEYEKDILIYAPNLGVHEGKCRIKPNGSVYFYVLRWNQITWRVTHWAELPDPPKEEE